VRSMSKDFSWAQFGSVQLIRCLSGFFALSKALGFFWFSFFGGGALLHYSRDMN